MKHHFELEYDKLREKIISMGAKVEEQLKAAIECYRNHDTALAEKVKLKI